jgi:hypothetical protein
MSADAKVNMRTSAARNEPHRKGDRPKEIFTGGTTNAREIEQHIRELLSSPGVILFDFKSG